MTSSSVSVLPGLISPSARPLSRIAFRFMPPPSSVTSHHDLGALALQLERDAPGRRACRAALRSSGVSMPCTTALRSMCSNGGSMRSSTWRSSSPAAPSTMSSARLPVSAAAWRTMRARRCTWRWKGTMRVRIRPFCSSVMVRACCCSRFCVSLREVLEQLLDARHVVGRLGERARELLDRGIAVELERIELAAVRAVSSSCRCRICASVSISSLRSCSFRRVTVRDSSPRLKSIEPSCCSRRARAMLDFAGNVEQLVEQLGVDARHLAALGAGDRLAARRHRLRRRQSLLVLGARPCKG